MNKILVKEPTQKDHYVTTKFTKKFIKNYYIQL